MPQQNQNPERVYAQSPKSRERTLGRDDVPQAGVWLIFQPEK